MNEIFKAYDVRGIYPEEINEDIVYKTGKAYVKLLQKELKKKKHIKIQAGRVRKIKQRNSRIKTKTKKQKKQKLNLQKNPRKPKFLLLISADIVENPLIHHIANIVVMKYKIS